jgi:hypothetical protein
MLSDVSTHYNTSLRVFKLRLVSFYCSKFSVLSDTVVNAIKNVPRNVSQTSGGYSLAYFKWECCINICRKIVVRSYPINRLIDDQLITPFFPDWHLTADHFPALPTAGATTSFGRCFGPGQIWQQHYCALLHFGTQVAVLESVLWNALEWSWRSACLVTPFARNHREETNSYDASWTVLLSYGTNMKAYVRKATRAVLNRSRLCVANARSRFEHQAARVRTLCHNVC